MPKIEYKIKELYDDIYLIESNKFDLAMMFFRAQEFLENPKYRNKKVAFWDLMRFYSFESGIFSYPDDFVGFNVSSKTLEKYGRVKEDLTPWDLEFSLIVNKIRNSSQNFYIIGTHKGDKRTLEHELAHAFYYMRPEYKRAMNKLIKESFSVKKMGKIYKELAEFDYHSSVFIDEIQAYSIDKSAPESLNCHLKKTRKKFRKVFLEHVKMK